MCRVLSRAKSVGILNLVTNEIQIEVARKAILVGRETLFTPNNSTETYERVDCAKEIVIAMLNKLIISKEF